MLDLNSPAVAESVVGDVLGVVREGVRIPAVADLITGLAPELYLAPPAVTISGGIVVIVADVAASGAVIVSGDQAS